MKASDYLREHERRRKEEANEEKPKEHTLQENARERAEHPDGLNAGTAYDWEDLDAYRQELDRMDKEGPKRHADRVQKQDQSGSPQD